LEALVGNSINSVSRSPAKRQKQIQSEIELEPEMTWADFPKLQKFLEDNGVPPEHPARCLNTGLLKALEFFFSLPEALRGLADQKKKFLQFSPGDGRTNESEVQQASFWAEVRATYLLGEILGAEILGFEQLSPYGKSGTCDLVAMFEGNRQYFEVKRKSSHARQRIPPRLEKALTELSKEIGYSLAPQLRKRDYDCEGLSELIAAIRAHSSSAPRDNLCKPMPFCSDVVDVYFDDVAAENEIWTEFELPDLPQDVEKYLLGRRDGKADLGKDGQSKVPMVEQCRRKGADYLICQIGFDSPAEIAEKCFLGVTRLNARVFEAKDPRLFGIKGILLFRTNFDWCLIRNDFAVSANGGESPTTGS
jgi:hypothetical protein